MTDFADFKTQIAEWANRGDWSPELVTSFVRSAEEKFNAELRVRRMIKAAEDTIDHSCAALPDDWLESDFMLIESDNAPQGWMPIRYKPKDQFFREPNVPIFPAGSWHSKSTSGYYTIEANTIWFGGTIDARDGTTFRMFYFGEVPVFSDEVNSWIYTKYPSLFRSAALMHADLHAVGEEDKAGGLKMLVEDQIKKLNDDYRLAKTSGSLLAKGRSGRSFG